MKKETLIQKIEDAFRDVKLEDGVGLWEAQGLNYYETEEDCRKRREKDEKEDWRNLSLALFSECHSSPSFFDAKGMRFHLPFFLLIDLDVYEKEIEKLEYGVDLDIDFILTHAVNYLGNSSKDAVSMLEHHHSQFSMLNTAQIKCVIAFLKYKWPPESYDMNKEIKLWEEKLVSKTTNT